MYCILKLSTLLWVLSQLTSSHESLSIIGMFFLIHLKPLWLWKHAKWFFARKIGPPVNIKWKGNSICISDKTEICHFVRIVVIKTHGSESCGQVKQKCTLQQLNKWHDHYIWEFYRYKCCTNLAILYTTFYKCYRSEILDF